MQELADRDRTKLIGVVLADARKRAGLTQQAVADHLERPQSFVAKIETGERRVDIPDFIAVSDALGVEPGRLLATVAKKLRGMDARRRFRRPAGLLRGS